MMAIGILLVGAAATAALGRRGGRAPWVGALASTVAAWLAGLVEARGLPHVYVLQEWPFVAGPTGRIAWVMLDFEWRVEVLVLSAILILLLAHAADSDRIETAEIVRILLSGAICLGALLSGNALTLAIILAVFLGYASWRTRGGPAQTPGFAASGDLTLACIVVLWLAAAAPASSTASWPAPAVLLALFALWMAQEIAAGGETDRADPGSLFTGKLLSIAIGLKFMAEAMRLRPIAPTEPWLVATAGLLALLALARSVLRPHGPASTIATAVGCLALLAASSNDASSSVLVLTWLAAVVLMSVLATQTLVIRARWDRLWGVPAVAMLLLMTSIAAEPMLAIPQGVLITAIELAVLGVGSAAIGVVVGRPVFAAAAEGGSDDPLARALSRLALALPAIVGIGVGLRGFPEISLRAALLAVASFGLSVVVLTTERGREGTRRRGSRAFEWLDPTPIAAGFNGVAAAVGGGVRSLMGLLEGGAGVLWAWVILLAIFLFRGRAG